MKKIYFITTTSYRGRDNFLGRSFSVAEDWEHALKIYNDTKGVKKLSMESEHDTYTQEERCLSDDSRVINC